MAALAFYFLFFNTKYVFKYNINGYIVRNPSFYFLIDVILINTYIYNRYLTHISTSFFLPV